MKVLLDLVQDYSKSTLKYFQWLDLINHQYHLDICGQDSCEFFPYINYLYHNTIAPGKLGWAWNLILQKNNYESIPDLIDLAYRYEESLPEIYIVNMLNWGTLDQVDFDEQAVWFPKSSRYNDVKRVLNLDKVKKYPKIFFPNLG